MLLPTCAYPFDPLLDEQSAVGEPSRTAARAAQEVLQDARAQLPGTFLVETRAVPSSSVARALTELAEDEAADLVVVGSSARERGAGDVATRLLHGSPCAVAVASRGYRNAPGIHHLGVAYDGSAEAEMALSAAYRIAAGLHADLTICSAAVAPRFGHGVLPAGQRAEAIAERIAEQARDRLTDAALRAPAPLVPDTQLVEGAPVQAITRPPPAW